MPSLYFVSKGFSRLKQAELTGYPPFTVIASCQLPSAVGRLFFKEAGHQFDQVARFVGAVQLVDEDLVPSIFTGPGGTR